ncbi:MAG: hypothetical protein COA45_00010 [Zetaproteobacteria bacterium]|nr:MAG: hypothetical protein COA45_00010 [Zetaproteobacteria bacterium]
MRQIDYPEAFASRYPLIKHIAWYDTTVTDLTLGLIKQKQGGLWSMCMMINGFSCRKKPAALSIVTALI